MRTPVIPLALCASLAVSAPTWSDQRSDNAEKVRVEIESVGLHPGMDPGLYVCAAGHLHIKGTVQNLTDAALGRIKVGGRAFDAEGNLLGTASASTKKATLAPGDRTEINIEFLGVTGELIGRVHRHDVTVLEVPVKSR